MVARLSIVELAQQFASSLPQGADRLGEDIKKNLKAMLGVALARMDLVTREEFDVQATMLARTRAKLDEMEKQIAALEALLLKHGQGPESEH